VSFLVTATREDVKAALDAKTTRNDAQIDRALLAATASVEGLLHRKFLPLTATKYFDWPNHQHARSWRLWLDDNDLVSVTSLVSGGTAITSADYFLYPSDGPPYSWLEIDLSSSSAFNAGSTRQRSIGITGVWSHSANEEPAGITAEGLDTSETGVDVTDSFLIGVGTIIKVESERMICTGKTMLDTGVNIDVGDSLAASSADVSITMSTTTAAPVAGETILIDSERMLVTDVAGTVLTVVRAWDGTVPATHAGGADIYAPRTLTVERGALGTTAAAHNTATAITRHVVPGLVRNLTIAEAVTILLQEQSGYARQMGQGENARTVGVGLEGLRQDCYRTFGRKARIRGV
jgi:hypothetical protein